VDNRRWWPSGGHLASGVKGKSMEAASPFESCVRTRVSTASLSAFTLARL